MKSAIALACLITFTMLSTQSAAQQQAQCGPYDKVTAHLSKKYGEVKSDMALTATQGLLLEVWRAKNSWTVIIINPKDNNTCVVSVGSAWKRLIVNKRTPKFDPS